MSDSPQTAPSQLLHWNQVLAQASAGFDGVPRCVAADAVLNQLLRVAVDLPLNPDSRCVLYTFAVALLICPSEVGLTVDVRNIPPFLRPVDCSDAVDAPLTEADVASIRGIRGKRLCGTCGLGFPAPLKVINLRYQNLLGRLTLGDAPSANRWHVEHHETSLALRHEDQANNEFAWQLLREFLPQYPDDHARLGLLAVGSDALKRQLNLANTWRDELRVWLAAEGDFGASHEGVAR